MAYNIYNDALPSFIQARQLLTMENHGRYLTGYSPKELPGVVITNCAHSIGWRLMRGYHAIRCKLQGTALAAFEQERSSFLDNFCTVADEAFLRRRDRDAYTHAMTVVELCFMEIGQLRRWLVTVGSDSEARMIELGLKMAEGIAG